jgi:hypothetical protein
VTDKRKPDRVRDTRTMDVPAGPGTHPELDPGVARLTAEQEGQKDAAAYDIDSLSVDLDMPYTRELRQQIEQADQDSRDAEVRSQQMADSIHADAAADRKVADTNVQSARDDAGKTAQRRDDLEITLTDPGPFHDPTRLRESTWKSLWLLLGVPILLGPLEIGINYTVMQGLNYPALETFLLAAGFSLLGILCPALAGGSMRAHRGLEGKSARRGRWGVVVVLLGLLFVVQAMLAVQRIGFLAAPQTDSEGNLQPSILNGLGIPFWLLVVGWWAVQIGLAVCVLIHAEKTHNPTVWAHRRAERLAAAAGRDLATAEAAAERARLVAESAEENRSRLAVQFQSQRDGMRALELQLVEIYGRSMCRAKGDPAFTSAMEERLERYAARRRGTSGGPTRLGRVS